MVCHLCPIYFTRSLGTSTTSSSPPHASGCVPRRSVEEHILQQLLLGHRSNEAGYLSVTDFYDIQAAFQSIDHDTLDGVVTGPGAQEEDKHFLQEQYRWCSVVQDIDGVDYMFRPLEGVFAGGAIGPKLYLRGLWSVLGFWHHVC